MGSKENTYDFSAVNNDGKTIYYKITSSATVEVSKYEIENYKDNGDIIIPNMVNHNGKIYNVNAIGEEAFSYCIGLISITIPDSVTIIGNSAFKDCSFLTSIFVDENNTAYVSNAGILFNKDQTILLYYPASKTGKSYTIPDTVTTIGDSAFSYCGELTSVTIPDSVTTIGSSAFYGCSCLTSITIGNSVTTIGDSVFSYCGELTSVTIPNSVTTIGDSAFYECFLTSISVDENNMVYASNAGILFNKNQTILLCYPAGKTGSYTIPDTITAIGDYAFEGCRDITSVTIPNSVTTIGDGAFERCEGLTSVTIPDAVTTIGNGAFEDCIGLTKIYVKAVNPPLIENNTFGNVSKSIPVYVCGSVDRYRKAYCWREFTNIIEDTGDLS